MDLDRQSIEKKDFPIGRRGYDPDAVDAHLSALAGEVDELRRQPAPPLSSGGAPSPPPRSLASAAATQVQAIVEAAETAAADIERLAEADARQINQDAEQAAEQTRDEAVTQAQAHVAGVSQATSLMLQRVDAMEGEVSALVESLRTGATRLTNDLSLLEGNMGELYDAAGGPLGEGSSGPGSSTALSDPPLDMDDVSDPGGEQLESDDEQDLSSAVEPPVAELVAELEAAELEAEIEERERSAASEPKPQSEPEPAPDPTSASGPPPQVDLDGARLIALNMALNGQPREEADRYLAENFNIPDRRSLLDEVYSAVDG